MNARKGSNSERELVKMFLGIGWQASRIAGSGKMNLAPDIIAGTKGRLLVIECKSSGGPLIYINHEEAANLIEYAAKFGAEAWYGFRFNHCEWGFVRAEQVLGKNKAYPNEGISLKGLISL